MGAPTAGDFAAAISAVRSADTLAIPLGPGDWCSIGARRLLDRSWMMSFPCVPPVVDVGRKVMSVRDVVNEQMSVRLFTLNTMT